MHACARCDVHTFDFTENPDTWYTLLFGASYYILTVLAPLFTNSSDANTNSESIAENHLHARAHTIRCAHSWFHGKSRFMNWRKLNMILLQQSLLVMHFLTTHKAIYVFQLGIVQELCKNYATISLPSASKSSLKIESVNKVFLFWYWQRPKKKFFLE